MDDFNPDTYLAAKSFDPDAYLADKGPQTSTAGAVGRGTLDALPFGTKAGAATEAALGPGKYGDYLKQLDQLLATDKEQHPVAHDVGEVTGSVAPFLIPGVGEALGAESVAGRAGIGAGIGAVQGASNTRQDLTSSEGLQDVLKGAGAGAVTGPAVGAIGDVLGGLVRGGGTKVAQAVSSEGDMLHVPPPVASVSEATAGEAPKFTPGDLVPMSEPFKEAPQAPQAVSPTPPTTTPPDIIAGRQKQGLFPSPEEFKAEVLAGQLGGSPRQLRSLPGKDPIQSLNHMYDVIKTNSTPDNPLISGTDRFSDRLNKFTDLQARSGKIIGDTIKSANIPPLQTQPISQQLQAAMKFPNPDDAAQMQTVIKQLETYAKSDSTPGAISFERLQQLKSDLGSEAFHGQGNKVLQAAYHVISDAQDNELNKVSTLINKPQFDQAKDAYQMTSRAIPMLKMATTRSLAKGYSSFGTPLAALVTGHPVAALGSLMKEPLERMVGAGVFNSGAASVPSGAEALASKAGGDVASLLSHPAMAPYKQAFQQATKGLTEPAEIQKQNTVTDFLMQSRNPAYAKARQQASEESANAF